MIVSLMRLQWVILSNANQDDQRKSYTKAIHGQSDHARREVLRWHHVEMTSSDSLILCIVFSLSRNHQSKEIMLLSFQHLWRLISIDHSIDQFLFVQLAFRPQFQFFKYEIISFYRTSSNLKTRILRSLFIFFEWTFSHASLRMFFTAVVYFDENSKSRSSYHFIWRFFSYQWFSSYVSDKLQSCFYYDCVQVEFHDWFAWSKLITFQHTKNSGWWDFVLVIQSSEALFSFIFISTHIDQYDRFNDRSDFWESV
jgi:hypothetical protein